LVPDIFKLKSLIIFFFSLQKKIFFQIKTSKKAENRLNQTQIKQLMERKALSVDITIEELEDRINALLENHEYGIVGTIDVKTDSEDGRYNYCCRVCDTHLKLQQEKTSDLDAVNNNSNDIDKVSQLNTVTKIEDSEKSNWRILGGGRNNFSLSHLLIHLSSNGHKKAMSKEYLPWKLGINNNESDPVANLLRSEELEGHGIEIEWRNNIRYICCSLCRTSKHKLLLSTTTTGSRLGNNVFFHIKGKEHETNKSATSSPGFKKQQLLPFGKPQQLYVTDFESPVLASHCHGYHTLNESMRNFLQMGQIITDDDDQPIAEPHWKKVVKLKTGDILLETDGCFRSKDCLLCSTSGLPFPNFTCSNCAKIGVGQQKRNLERAATQSEANSSLFKNNRYMNPTETQKKLAAVTAQMRLKSQHLFIIRLRSLQKQALRSPIEEMKVLAGRILYSENLEDKHNKDVIAMIRNIIIAYQQGHFDAHSTLFSFLSDSIKNLGLKGSQKRYKDTTKAIFAALTAVGGPRVTTLLTDNVAGPSQTTIRKALRKEKPVLGVGESEISINFAYASDLYEKLMKAKNIKPPILCSFAEDETTIEVALSYCFKRKRLIGFIGNNNSLSFDSYADVLKAAHSNKLGNYLRLITITPLHNELPVLIALISATDNKFTTMDVHRQWNLCKDMYTKYLYNLFGTASLGHCSDGDGRRSNLQLANMRLSPSNNIKAYRYNWCGCLLWATISVDDISKNTITNVHSQDQCHVAKKLMNSIDVASRHVSIGTGTASYSVVALLVQKTANSKTNDTAVSNKFNLIDIDRKDRQNFLHVQRASQFVVQHALMQEFNESKNPDFLATSLYLKMIHKYLLCWAGNQYSMQERISMAGYVLTFLCVLYSYNKHKKKSEDKYGTLFITHQCFRDTIISMNSFLLLIKILADLNLTGCPNLMRHGSDVVEIVFSRLGGWSDILANRNFNFFEAICSLETMFALESLQVNAGIVLHRRHSNKEFEAISKEARQDNRTLTDSELYDLLQLKEQSVISSLNLGSSEAIADLARAGVVYDKEKAFGHVEDDFLKELKLAKFCEEEEKQKDLMNVNKTVKEHHSSSHGVVTIDKETQNLLVNDDNKFSAMGNDLRVDDEDDLNNEIIPLSSNNLNKNSDNNNKINNNRPQPDPNNDDHANNLVTVPPKTQSSPAATGKEDMPTVPIMPAISEKEEELAEKLHIKAEIEMLLNKIEESKAPVKVSTLYLKKPDGTSIHIQKLLQQINNSLIDNKLSADRLTRVQQGSKVAEQLSVCSFLKKNTDAEEDGGDADSGSKVPKVSLGSTAAFYFLEGKNSKYYIGQITTMYTDTNLRLRDAIPISPPSGKIKFHVNWLEGNPLQSLTYSNVAGCDVYHNNLICPVALLLIPPQSPNQQSKFKISQSDFDNITECMKLLEHSQAVVPSLTAAATLAPLTENEKAARGHAKRSRQIYDQSELQRPYNANNRGATGNNKNNNSNNNNNNNNNNNKNDNKKQTVTNKRQKKT
jgi:hypothetical protein